MPKLQDLTGRQFGRWSVVRRGGTSHSKKPLWLCRCDCPLGTEKLVESQSLVGGLSTSCGCYQKERVSEATRTHGHSRPNCGGRTRTYRIWSAIKNRCFCETSWDYPDYGGRGITMCREWADDFEAFLGDVGEIPEGMTVDRIDNEGDYRPGNVRIATRLTQARNTRRTVRVEFNGESLTLGEWGEKLSIPAGVLRWRRHNGWSVEETLTTPYVAKPQLSKPKSK